MRLARILCALGLHDWGVADDDVGWGLSEQCCRCGRRRSAGNPMP
jgi:hypothetical protein